MAGDYSLPGNLVPGTALSLHREEGRRVKLAQTEPFVEVAPAPTFR